jgi:tetratricopeptide (TPR) repeat protein
LAPVIRPKELPQFDLQKTLAAVAQGRYAAAEGELKASVEQQPALRARVQVALAEVEAMTARSDQALARARPHCETADPLANDACRVAAEALRRRGDLEDAQRLLAKFENIPKARYLHLALAELLSDRGRVAEARVQYQRLVDDFAQGRIATDDAVQLAIAGRAAHRLGNWREANEFFNRAELTGVGDLTTLLWRGDLYLDAHDPKHARAVADEALRFAPDHPAALLLAARVRLAAIADADQAEQYLQRALSVDRTRADAHAILAGLALRDLDFERAEARISEGLVHEPGHLELLSLRAVGRFLADDQPGFDAAVREVLRRNPSHARVYRLVADYAEAEHRYGDTIPLLRRAVTLDPDDFVVRAQLGMQLLRSGSEAEGRENLERAFRRAPFDQRVKFTLDLYANKVDKEYSTIRHGRFVLRLPNRYRELLEAIVPGWVDQAVGALQKRYGRLASSPVFVEIYADEDSFGVRTSGVPATFLQGVCFGQTIVARLPTDEPTNLGMTLWHELSHVFHLQLSKHRVPRWFTEGLAEVETARARSDWSREQDLSLYQALERGHVPATRQMNRAFSHASTLEDLGIAYVASTYLVDYIERTYGADRITKMLKAWGQHLSTEQVVSRVLGTDLDQLDQAYRREMSQHFVHFKKQFLPRRNPGSAEVARERFVAHPNDPSIRATLAHAELLRGQLGVARDIIARAPPEAAQHPDLLWITSMIGLADQRPEPARAALEGLVRGGHDGYFVQMQLALVARMKSDPELERAALTRAHEYYATASEPLYRLAAMARQFDDRQAESAALTTLAQLEESDVGVHRRRVELYVELGQPKQAMAATEGLIFANPIDAGAHELKARVAWLTHDRHATIRELGYALKLTPAGNDRKKLERLLSEVSQGRALEKSAPGDEMR